LFVDVQAEARLAAADKRLPGERMVWRERVSTRRVDMYQRALDVSHGLGGAAQLNHPRWHWGVDGALLAELGRRGMGFVEIGNQAFAAWNQGTAAYASAEAMWDEALAAGVVVWGVASDDAHHYYDVAARARGGERVYAAGTGFVMVRAERDPAAIRAAMERGDFYSSTGVLLAAVARSGEPDRSALEITVASPGEHEIVFIGSRGGAGGQVLHRRRGARARYVLQEPGYVRAEVIDAAGRKAWVQPVFVTAPQPR
jgi:hypothetical protein